ncbi:hypothetical protein NUM3379_35310 [Kineococcus sp. NUM-3379]
MTESSTSDGGDGAVSRQELSELTAVVRGLSTGLEQLARDVEDLTDAMPQPGPENPPGEKAPGKPGAGTGGGKKDEEEFEPFYPSVVAWVEGYFAPMYARALGPNTRWCARWWDHAEAHSRLDALWRSWETLRLDPFMGMATWYRDHLDSQLGALLNPAGPFAQCGARHSPLTPLPTEPYEPTAP